MTNHFPDKGAKAWMLKYLKSNFWRVAPWYDFEDWIQEGYVAYYEVLQRYPTAKEPSHIMSLFKLVLRSRIEDIVRSYRKQVDDAASDYIENCDSEEILTKDYSNFHAQLIKAPKMVKEVVAALMDPKNSDALDAPYKRYDNGRRETFNERIYSILGLKPDTIDLVRVLRMHFQ